MKSNITIWFVCAGNICRSVIAEHAFRKIAQERGLPVETVRSAGLIAISDDVPIDDTLRAARKAGFDLSAHRAQRFLPQAIEPNARIFVMEHGQKVTIRESIRLRADAVQLLGALVPGVTDEIADPENETEAGFDACVARIIACVTALAEQLTREAHA